MECFGLDDPKQCNICTSISSTILASSYKKAVIASLLTGFLSGLMWYYLGDWQPKTFYLNIHPVWIGSSINVLTIVIVTLLDKKAEWVIRAGKSFHLSYISLGAGIILTGVNVILFDLLYQNGLTGLFGFTTIMSYFIAIVQFFRPIQKNTQSLSKVSTR